MKTPPGLSYLPPECLELRLKPPTTLPKCAKGQCYSYIVNIDEDEHRWRCVKCLHYLVVPLRRTLFDLFT